MHRNKKKGKQDFPPDLIYDICSHSADTDQGQKNFPSWLLVQGQHSENLLAFQTTVNLMLLSLSKKQTKQLFCG